MQKIMTIDIETLPTTNIDVIAKIGSTINPPANYKKQDTIDQWMTENYEIELKNKVSKTALDGGYGMVACIAWNIEGYAVNTNWNESEIECLNKLYGDIESSGADTFCGHYISSFDLPFLLQRSIILGIKPPQAILKAMRAKSWDDCIKDTHLMWTGDRNKHIGLGTLCWILGVDHGSPDFDGSMVADTWADDPHKVIDYCAHDVKATVEIYNKLTFGEAVF
jgi:hypothetical protein